MQTPDKQNPGWADRPEVQQRIRYLLYSVCALLVIADLLVHRHTYLPVEEIPAFYAFYGFAALVGVVMLAKALRQRVGRSEDYYRKEGEHDA
ncbi:MAG: hypothetical protein R3F50_12705 [Gammaproteobacteria bacterium]|jgi:hypothetical protein